MWRLKVQSLCRLGAHVALSKLAGEKKSPIGFKPFAVGCIKYVLYLHTVLTCRAYVLYLHTHVFVSF